MNPSMPNDIAFYRERIPSSGASILELGCGTGRVLVPLVKDCAYIHGVDVSAAMVSICREKLANALIPATRACVQVGDITNLSLDKTFDLITAPCRVFQNLETDAETNGFFETVRKHLAPGGRCVLDVFKPKSDRAAMRQEWAKQEEYGSWERLTDGGRITCCGRSAHMHPEKMILYPELIYRTYHDNRLVEEVVLSIVMRCYYAEEFEQMITGHGFEILQRWGGYSGETYGEGPELLIEFQESIS